MYCIEKLCKVQIQILECEILTKSEYIYLLILFVFSPKCSPLRLLYRFYDNHADGVNVFKYLGIKEYQ